LAIDDYLAIPFAVLMFIIVVMTVEINTDGDITGVLTAFRDIGLRLGLATIANGEVVDFESGASSAGIGALLCKISDVYDKNFWELTTTLWESISFYEIGKMFNIMFLTTPYFILDKLLLITLLIEFIVFYGAALLMPAGVYFLMFPKTRTFFMSLIKIMLGVMMKLYLVVVINGVILTTFEVANSHAGGEDKTLLDFYSADFLYMGLSGWILIHLLRRISRRCKSDV